VDDIFELLWATTAAHPKRSMASVCPLLLPSSLEEEQDGNIKEDSVDEVDHAMGTTASATTMSTAIPKRLWARLVTIAAGIDETLVWGGASKDAVRRLATAVAACPLEMTGKGTFKQEFVTAGGVSLKAIDMKTMQVRSQPGLFVCGELINVDGVTGA